jgi:hypothetical protein
MNYLMFGGMAFHMVGQLNLTQFERDCRKVRQPLTLALHSEIPHGRPVEVV